MAETITLTGPKEWGGLPQDCRVRVESLPDGRLVYDGDDSGSVSLRLDDGRYRAAMWKHFRDGTGVKHVQEFNVGISGEEWRQLRVLRPQMARGAQTSQGIVYVCNVPPGCGKKFTSATAAALHEAEFHFGQTRAQVLASPAITMQHVAEQASVAAAPKAKAEADKAALVGSRIRRGRPRKVLATAGE